MYAAIDPHARKNAKVGKKASEGVTGEPRILGASLRKEVYGSISDTALTNEASKKATKKSVQNEKLQASSQAKEGGLET